MAANSIGNNVHISAKNGYTINQFIIYKQMVHKNNDRYRNTWLWTQLTKDFNEHDLTRNISITERRSAS